MGTGDKRLEERDKRVAARNKREQSKRKRQSTQEEYQVLPEDCIVIMALAIAFMAEGGALRTGKTRDGGALALGCYKDDDYTTEYIRPQEDLGTAANEIADAWLEGGAASLYEAQRWLWEGLKAAMQASAPKRA